MLHGMEFHLTIILNWKAYNKAAYDDNLSVKKTKENLLFNEKMRYHL